MRRRNRNGKPIKPTTAMFVRQYCEGTLKRKTQCGTYRILKGDHCDILVQMRTRDGSPGSTNLCAIGFNTSDKRIVFISNWFDPNFTSMEGPHIQYTKLPRTILSDEDSSILSSGIIAINEEYILVEFGDTPYLLARNTDALKYNCTLIKAFRLDTRVSSIEAALLQLDEPTGLVNVANEWWAQEMPAGFEPPGLHPSIMEAYRKQLNPFDFGFTMEDCERVSYSYYNNTPDFWIPKRSKHSTPNGAKWLAAVHAGERAETIFGEREPGYYENLTCQATVYGSSVENREGRLVVTESDGVYVKGKIHSKQVFDEVTDLKVWHKLIKMSSSIRIPKLYGIF